MAAEIRNDSPLSSSSSPLDASDIIQQYMDSDASDLSPPPPILDLAAEVSRLLDQQSSQSESDVDAGSPQRGSHSSPRRRKNAVVQAQAAPFTVESTSAAADGCTSSEASRPLEQSGIGSHATTNITGPPNPQSEALEQNSEQVDTHTVSEALSSERTTNLAIHRLQSNESTGSHRLTGSLQHVDSPRSSSSQLSDDLVPRPLAEEMEEADERERLQEMAASDCSSELYNSSEEDSESEGRESESDGLLDEIDFELQEDVSSPQNKQAEQRSSKLSLVVVTGAQSKSANVGECDSKDKREDVQLKPTFLQAHTSTERDSAGTYGGNLPHHTPKENREKLVANDLRNGSISLYGAQDSDDPPPVVQSDNSAAQLIYPSPPLTVPSANNNQTTGTVSSDALQGQITPPPEPKAQHKTSTEMVTTKHPVFVKRFTPPKRQAVPPMPEASRRRNTHDNSFQDETKTGRLFAARRSETGMPNEVREVKRTSEREHEFSTASFTENFTPGATKERFLITSMSASSVVATGQSEREEIIPDDPPVASEISLSSTDTSTIGPTTSSLQERPMLELPTSADANVSLHTNTALVGAQLHNTLGNGSLKPALVSSSVPSPAAFSSPRLPLKGILKKHSRFGSTTSTNSDITTVTPLGSETSSNTDSQEEVPDIPDTLFQHTPQGTSMLPADHTREQGSSIGKITPQDSVLGLLEGVTLSGRISPEEGDCELDRTLTEEPSNVTESLQPKQTNSVSVTHTDSGIASDGENPRGKNWQEAFRQLRKMHSDPLMRKWKQTSSSVGTHRPHFHSNLEIAAHARHTNSELTPTLACTKGATTPSRRISEEPIGGAFIATQQIPDMTLQAKETLTKRVSRL